MSNNEQSRIERLESLAEKILLGLAETKQAIDALTIESKQKTDSNAKAIQALASAVESDRKEYKKDRARLYEALSRMAAAQSHFWEIQADYYSRLELIDERQAKMTEILERLDEQNNNG